jgi:hypothetical protein
MSTSKKCGIVFEVLQKSSTCDIHDRCGVIWRNCFDVSLPVQGNGWYDGLRQTPPSENQGREALGPRRKK